MNTHDPFSCVASGYARRSRSSSLASLGGIGLAPLPASLLAKAMPRLQLDHLSRLWGVFDIVLVNFYHALRDVPPAEAGDLLERDGVALPRVNDTLDIHEVLRAVVFVFLVLFGEHLRFGLRHGQVPSGPGVGSYLRMPAVHPF